MDALDVVMGFTGDATAELAEYTLPPVDQTNTQGYLEDGYAFIFSMAVVLLRTLLEVAANAKTVVVAVDGTLLDDDGLEQHACLLSVEATRETAESFDWEAFDDRQILERFDLRFADGKPIVVHINNQPEDGLSGSSKK